MARASWCTRRRTLLELAPVLSDAQILRTAEAIATVQLPTGAIPEYPGGVANPWNHVEAAMALDVGGHKEPAERAYRWLATTQRADGGWSAGYLGDEVVDATLDSNFCSYIAFGLRHHFEVTRDRSFLEEMWPVMERAIDFVLQLQQPDGSIAWARDGRGRVWPSALLTSCSCILMSLRSAVAVARGLGHDRPEWELSAALLQAAIQRGGPIFEPKARFSMDWYYPVLARAVQGAEAKRRLKERWDRFVIAGRGTRCVAERPWVTSGETAELVLSLHVANMPVEANLLLGWVQHLRDADGAYWIGATHPDATVWPRHKPTWGSGSVILAADALAGGPTARCL